MQPSPDHEYNPVQEWLEEQSQDYERLRAAARRMLSLKGPDDPQVLTALGEVQSMDRLLTGARAAIAASTGLTTEELIRVTEEQSPGLSESPGPPMSAE